MEGVILPRARTRPKRRLSFGAISCTCSRKKSSPMSPTPGVLPRERLRIASATFSLQTRLVVCSPSVTSFGNGFTWLRTLASTPRLSRSACAEGSCTSLSRLSQKAATLEVIASCEVWVAAGVHLGVSRRDTPPSAVGCSVLSTAQEAGSWTSVVGCWVVQGVAILPWPEAALRAS
eukprot:scaffold28540_cov26-Phaeocystis_antarctica.AAC.2